MKKGLINKFLSLFLVFSLLFAAIPTGQIKAAATITVCPGGGCDFTTIQAAIDAAGGGDTIEVGPGTYPEAIVLNKPNITVKSTDGAETTIIDVPAGSFRAVSFTDNLGTVTFEGFTVKNFTSAGVGQNYTSVGTTVRIIDNIVTSAGYYIYNLIDVSGDGSVVSGNRITASGNPFPHHGQAGNAAIMVMNGSNITIANNVINGGLADRLGLDIAIVIWNYSNLAGTTMSNIQVEGNSVTNVNWLLMIYEETNLPVNLVTVEKNKFTDYNYITWDDQPRDISRNWWGSPTGPDPDLIVGDDVTYAPWCGDGDCTFQVDMVQPGEGLQAAINRTSVGGTLFVPDKFDDPTVADYSDGGMDGYKVSGKHLILEDGVIIANIGHCFTIQGSHTWIQTESPGGAKCIIAQGKTGTTSTSSGVYIYPSYYMEAMEDLVIDGLEITGLGLDGVTYNPYIFTGISFGYMFGGLKDVIVANNHIHDIEVNPSIAYSGFAITNMLYSAIGGEVTVQGNLFQRTEGIDLSDFGSYDVTYNSWGAYNVTNVGATNLTFDPWTHAAIELEPSETTLAPDDVFSIDVIGVMQKITAANFTFKYDPEAFELVGITNVTTAFQPGWNGLINYDTVAGEIVFDGTSFPEHTSDDEDGTVLYTVTLKALKEGEFKLGINPDSDEFGMFPGSGPSMNVFAASLDEETIIVVEPLKVTEVDLLISTVIGGAPLKLPKDGLAGPFRIALDPTVTWHYLGVTDIVSNKEIATGSYPFKNALDQEVFTLEVTEIGGVKEYFLRDTYFDDGSPLRMFNEDPYGEYTFTGNVADESGVTGEVSITVITSDAIAYLKANTTLDGTLANLTATYPDSIPPSIEVQDYYIDTRMTLDDAVPTGTTISIERSVAGGAFETLVSNATVPGLSFWLTDLLTGVDPADFGGVAYNDYTETYKITLKGPGGSDSDFTGNITIESIISRDDFVSDLVVLASKQLPVTLPGIYQVYPSRLYAYDPGNGSTATDGFNVVAGFINFKMVDVASLVISLYDEDDAKLQTNTLTDLFLDNAAYDGITSISSPFDVRGTFDYAADGNWDVEDSMYGNETIPAYAFATITLTDGQVLTATIGPWPAGAFPSLEDYKAALAAVTESWYTPESWAIYQAVVAANPAYLSMTQAQIDAATAAIIAAQADLVLRGDILTEYPSRFYVLDETNNNNTGVIGYGGIAKFVDFKLGEVVSLSLSAYDVNDVLLQTNTLTGSIFTDHPTLEMIMTSFDVFGTFDYEADGNWLVYPSMKDNPTIPRYMMANVTLFNGKVISRKIEMDQLMYDLEVVKLETTITGTLNDFQADFPTVIPQSVIDKGYYINSRITLGAALPEGAEVYIQRGTDTFGPLTLVGAGPWWYTELLGLPLTDAAAFDSTYDDAVEEYSVWIEGTHVAIDTTLTVESVISTDKTDFDPLVVLASHTMDVKFDETIPPTLDIQGAIADGDKMLELGGAYVLVTKGTVGTNHLIGFETGTVSSEPLALTDPTYFGLFLDQSDPVLISELKAYFAAVVGMPSTWYAHMIDVAEGTAPWAYIKATPGTLELELIDGAMHDMGQGDLPLIIADDAVIGLFTVKGVVKDLQGNASAAVELSLQVVRTLAVGDVDLLYGTDPAVIDVPLIGDLTNGFEMELDPAVKYYYLDAVIDVNNGLAEGMYPFFMSPDTTTPIFYVDVDEDGNVMLVDGWQYLNQGGVKNPLRINGDFAAGDYTYTGELTDIYGSTLPISIDITFTRALVSSVSGTVSMQGRTTRAGVLVTLAGDFGYGPYKATSSNQVSDNVSFSDMGTGVYTITVSHPRYLSLTLTHDATIDIAALNKIATLELRGGDANGNNEIDGGDSSIVGTQYGTGTIESAGDVNFDGKVNIQDLAMIGGNYGLQSTTPGVATYAYGNWMK